MLLHKYAHTHGLTHTHIESRTIALPAINIRQIVFSFLLCLPGGACRGRGSVVGVRWWSCESALLPLCVCVCGCCVCIFNNGIPQLIIEIPTSIWLINVGIAFGCCCSHTHTQTHRGAHTLRERHNKMIYEIIFCFIPYHQSPHPPNTHVEANTKLVIETKRNATQ